MNSIFFFLPHKLKCGLKKLVKVFFPPLLVFVIDRNSEFPKHSMLLLTYMTCWGKISTFFYIQFCFAFLLWSKTIRRFLLCLMRLTRYFHRDESDVQHNCNNHRMLLVFFFLFYSLQLIEKSIKKQFSFQFKNNFNFFSLVCNFFFVSNCFVFLFYNVWLVFNVWIEFLIDTFYAFWTYFLLSQI